MRRCPTQPVVDRDHVMLAPSPSESGIYPIGVFSDAETTLSSDEVEEVLHGFSDVGARLRSRHVRR